MRLLLRWVSRLSGVDSTTIRRPPQIYTGYLSMVSFLRPIFLSFYKTSSKKPSQVPYFKPWFSDVLLEASRYPQEISYECRGDVIQYCKFPFFLTTTSSVSAQLGPRSLQLLQRCVEIYQDGLLLGSPLWRIISGSSFALSYCSIHNIVVAQRRIRKKWQPKLRNK